ncbi:MAG TPA: thioredoxin family protein [Pirellulales bacterium]|nr:thioredoxin family protein [Pirellulales bacterium]
MVGWISLAWVVQTGFAHPPEEVVTVRGRVIDQAGQPVADVEAWVSTHKILVRARSGADGSFELSVPAKRIAGLTLQAADDGGARQALHQFSYDQTSAPPEVVSLVLRPAREIALTVVDAKGIAVSGAWVAAVSNYHKVAGAETDAAGKAMVRVPVDSELRYVVAGKADIGLDYFVYRGMKELASDPYKLPPDHSDPLHFVLNGTRTVTVCVHDDHEQPMVGVDVNAWYFEKPKKGDILNTGLDEFRAMTDSQGVATLSILPADNKGKVVVWVRRDGYVAADRTVWDPQSGEDSLTATLQPLVRVSGSVKLPDGRPAANIEVLIAGAGYQTDSFHGSARTDADGRFTLMVNPDQYYKLVPVSRDWTAPPQRFVLRSTARDGVDFTLQTTTRIYGRVTIGDENSPAANTYVQLYYGYTKDSDEYHNKLPAAEKLPNPKDDHKAIIPMLVHSGKTGDDGRFEFFAGPGSYYMMGPPNSERPTFEITTEREFEINLRGTKPDRAEIAGRVVSKNNTAHGVAEATVEGLSINSAAVRRLNAVTDKNGTFRAERPTSEMIVYARSSDGHQAGIVNCEADDKQVDIPIGPLATVRGRLIDDKTREPLADKWLEYGVYVKYSDGTSNWNFGGQVTTGEGGAFALAGLVPGQEYVLYVGDDFGVKGGPRRWHNVGNVNAPNAGIVAIDDVALKLPGLPPTINERIAKEFAIKRPHLKQLHDALRDARLGYQRVLVVSAAPEDDLCRQFYTMYYDYEHGDIRSALADYVLVAADVADGEQGSKAQKLASRIGFALPEPGDVTLAVIGDDGKLVAQLSCRAIESEGQLDRGRLKSFLNEHAPPMPDAEEVLAQALGQAGRENKRVLVQHSGAYCGWCVILSRYLDDHRATIAKDYVYVKLDSRFRNGETVVKRLRNEPGGIPWMVILDADGKRLITSTGPNGNIGHPSSPEGREHFAKMLRSTARHMSEQEIKTLLDALE